MVLVLMHEGIGSLTLEVMLGIVRSGHGVVQRRELFYGCVLLVLKLIGWQRLVMMRLRGRVLPM